jgi:selenium metabolism protein YedF
MTKRVDARGLTCPAPVLLIKNIVEKEQAGALSVVVDNEASRENVTRFLVVKGYLVEEEKEGDDFVLSARKDEDRELKAAEVVEGKDSAGESKKILILIMVDRLGRGDDTLGERLMLNYLKTLKEMGPELWQIIFVNGGVNLVTKSSPVLKELQEYEKDGVIVLACGTCLEHFGLTSEKSVGESTNMLDIVTATQLADKVITIS